MAIKYFIFISLSVLVFELSTIRTLQENEKTQYKNSLKEFETLIAAKKRDQNESRPLAQNPTEHMIKSKIKIPIEKKKLRAARNILIQLRDFIYSTEVTCIRNSSKTTNSTVTGSTLDNTLPLSTIFPTINALLSPITTSNEGKHCIRWKNFFEQCNHRDFLPIKIKVKSSWDRRVFAEQTDVLIKCTGKFRTVHLEEQWYRQTNYSKEVLIGSLKEHTTFDDNFLTFVGVLYDIVVDFYEHWRLKLESRLMES